MRRREKQNLKKIFVQCLFSTFNDTRTVTNLDTFVMQVNGLALLSDFIKSEVMINTY